jgi:diguanylate cyclase (GGDEF)-like protein
MRVTDILARTGGEEFGALLPETSAEDVRRAAERLRRSIAGLSIETSAGPIRMTASIGFSSLMPGEERIEPALARADAALYRAKQNGRDRVESG